MAKISASEAAEKHAERFTPYHLTDYRMARIMNKQLFGELCNGSTYDSDSYCLGSNPSSPAIVAADCAQFAATFLLRKSRRSSHTLRRGSSRIEAGFDALWTGIRLRGLRSVRGDVFAAQKPTQLTYASSVLSLYRGWLFGWRTRIITDTSRIHAARRADRRKFPGGRTGNAPELRRSFD